MKEMEKHQILKAECIHCHRCRDACAFLSKYNIDIGDKEALKRLAYSCFLCGRCKTVCPVGIDGRAEVMRLRHEIVAEGGEALKRAEKAHRACLWEKRRYIYRNHRNLSSGSVFFPGCNLPSLFPKTAARISSLFADNGIGTIYDCCGKPVAELGFANDEERILLELAAALSAAGVTELVTACPNCRGFFGERLGIPVVSVYTKLSELGLGERIHGTKKIFMPCPDRYTQQWIDELRPFCDGELLLVDSIQCCGLGGGAAALEPDLAWSFAEEMRTTVRGFDVAFYCASCAGRLAAGGFRDARHILSEIVGIDERPDTGKSYINRMLTKIK